MGWGQFLTLVITTYLGINVAFAIAYLSCGPNQLVGPGFDGVSNGMSTFLRAFFFSIETFGTIGYGNIAPAGVAAGFVMTTESLLTLLFVALVTGLIFARFSRPSAKILYSRMAIVAPYRDISGFMFRCANERTNHLLEVSAKVLYSRLEERNGVRTRAFTVLPLEFERVTFFTLSWTVVHPIDDVSPLKGCTHADLVANDAEFFVLLTGTDETFSQVVHSRTSYKPHEVVWNAKFQPMFVESPETGTTGMDLSRIHDIVPVDRA